MCGPCQRDIWLALDEIACAQPYPAPDERRYLRDSILAQVAIEDRDEARAFYDRRSEDWFRDFATFEAVAGRLGRPVTDPHYGQQFMIAIDKREDGRATFGFGRRLSPPELYAGSRRGHAYAN